MRAEAGGVGHRDVGTAQRPLEGALEVAMAREPQPAPLGVAQAEPLDGRLRRRTVRRARHPAPLLERPELLAGLRRGYSGVAITTRLSW